MVKEWLEEHTNSNDHSIPAKVLLYSTVAVILTIGMWEITSILTTFFFSIFTALIFTPPVRWLKRKGIQGGLSVVLVILLFNLIILVLGIIVARVALKFGSQIPNYQGQLNALADNLARYAPSHEEFTVHSIVRSIISVTISLMVIIVNPFVNAGATAGIIIVTAAFLLIDAASAPEKVHQKIENYLAMIHLACAWT